MCTLQICILFFYFFIFYSFHVKKYKLVLLYRSNQSKWHIGFIFCFQKQLQKQSIKHRAAQSFGLISCLASFLSVPVSVWLISGEDALWGLIESSMDEAASQLERDHVHSVYERIAPYFNDSRYKAWPKVKQFLLEQEPGSIVADVGKASCSIFNVFQTRTKTLRRARSMCFYLCYSHAFFVNDRCHIFI